MAQAAVGRSSPTGTGWGGTVHTLYVHENGLGPRRFSPVPTVHTPYNGDGVFLLVSLSLRGERGRAWDKRVGTGGDGIAGGGGTRGSALGDGAAIRAARGARAGSCRGGVGPSRRVCLVPVPLGTQRGSRSRSGGTRGTAGPRDRGTRVPPEGRGSPARGRASVLRGPSATRVGGGTRAVGPDRLRKGSRWSTVLRQPRRRRRRRCSGSSTR